MDNAEDSPNEYEKNEIGKINKWKQMSPNAFDRGVGFVLQPISWLAGKVIPPTAIEGALNGFDWLSNYTIDVEDIFRSAAVSNLDELRACPLEKLDQTSDEIRNWAIGYAAFEGLAAGAVGFVSIPADIPFIIGLALRTIRKIGCCYGYGICEHQNVSLEREYVRGILSSVGSNSMNEKVASLLMLRSIQTILIKETWKSMAQKAMSDQLSKQAALIGLKQFSKQLGVNLTKRKLGQIIPLIGAAVGGSVNGLYISDVGEAAIRSYQERWLIDRGKLLLQH